MKLLVDAIHNESCLAGIQLTHAGFFSDRSLAPSGTPHEQMSAHVLFNPAAFNWCRRMTDTDEAGLIDAFRNAAACAITAGFDCLEIHCGHGYLLSQWLSPRTNPGASFSDRLSLPLRVLQAVREDIGNRAIVMAKMNIFDGMESGLSLKEVSEIAEAFATKGGVDILAISGGMILENGLYMLRGQVPLGDMISAQTSWLKKISLLLFGPFVVPHIPFEELFFREAGLCVLRTIQQLNRAGRTDTKVCLIGGIHSVKSLDTAMADGFDLAQCGRAILYDPQLPKKWRQDASGYSGCTKCNRCIVAATMRQEVISCTENAW